MRKPDHTGKSVRQAIDGSRDQFVRSIGHNLLVRRLACGLTQQQAAELVDIQPESVSRIENGVIVPTLLRLRQFARIYGCSLARLIEDASDQPNDLASRIALELSALNDADRRFVVSQITSLARHLHSESRGRDKASPRARGRGHAESRGGDGPPKRALR